MTSSTISTRRLDLALAILRLAVGAVFIAHGGQKLFVYGFDGVSGAFAQMGVPLPGLVGPFVALLEFFGGIALVVGFLTRYAAVGLAATMVGAIALVHAPAGFFLPNGSEFAISLLAGTAALALAGAGGFAVDAALGHRRAR